MKKLKYSITLLLMTLIVATTNVIVNAEPIVIEQFDIPPVDQRPQGVQFYKIYLIDHESGVELKTEIYSTTFEPSEAEATILEQLSNRYEIVEEQSGIVSGEESPDFDVVMKIVVSEEKENTTETLAKQADDVAKTEIAQVENFDDLVKVMKRNTQISLIGLQMNGDKFEEILTIVKAADGDWEQAELDIYDRFPEEFGVDKSKSADDVRVVMAQASDLEMVQLEAMSDVYFVPMTSHLAAGNFNDQLVISYAHTLVAAEPSIFSEDRQQAVLNYILEVFQEQDLMTEEEFKQFSQEEVFKAYHQAIRLGSDAGYVVQLLKQAV